ncbi:MAG: hypothetical protein DHS20C13_13300 [Thermodesulfobacteriota bacterium]|nr:MAG: hypothetical protein DHS20C13_13300 [Thermodesulfobacteriota bacterium]
MKKYTLKKISLFLGLLLMVVSISLGDKSYGQGEMELKEELKESELSGADLWSQNCSRCHNVRSPQEYNDAQWNIIVSHMRVIGGIPAAQARAITKFLQETNDPPPQPIAPTSADKTTEITGQELILDAENADVINGKALYKRNCAACHGTSGKGDGPAAVSMRPKPRDLADEEYMQTLSDAYLLEVITYGGASVDKSPLMPGWGNVMDQKEIIDIIVYLQGLSKKK